MVARILLVLCLVVPLWADPVLAQEPASAALPEPATAHDESTWRAAGAVELGIFQSVHGAIVGMEVCKISHCRPNRTANNLFGGMALGGVVGTGVGLALRPHQAMLVNSGTALGLLHGVALTWDHGSHDEESTWLTGQLLGTTVGAVAGQLWHPENGRIALANSVALWSATTMALARLADKRGSVGAWTMGAADLGFVFGLLAWDSKPLPRLRVAAIDVAAALGLALGSVVGSAVGIATSKSDPALWGAAAGALTGAVLGATLVPLPDKALNVQVIPQPNGLALVGGF